MIVALGLLAVVWLGVVAIHMVQPRRPRVISSARFFERPERPVSLRDRFRLALPITSLAFWLRLAAISLGLAGLGLAWLTRPTPAELGLGVAVIIDTSASMTTQQNGAERLAAAQQTAAVALNTALTAAGVHELCWQIYALDLELRELGQGDRNNIGGAAGLVQSLSARPLGTDLDLIRGLVEQAASASAPDDCAWSQVVVVTDQPAPAWVNASEAGPVMLWQDIGTPVANAGFSQLEAERDPLTGLVRAVVVEVSAYGPPPAAHLRVADAQGQVVVEASAQWDASGQWHTPIALPAPGTYTLTLDPPDDYRWDNSAVMVVADGQSIAADCQIADCSLFAALGWTGTAGPPVVRITAARDAPDDLPALMVGPLPVGDPPQPIQGFVEADPLLAGLNFDVVEHIGMVGAPLPDGFRAVLWGGAGGTWLATRDDPLAAYVPGIPAWDPQLASFDEVYQARLTVVLNAVRWLLGTRPLAPLYELTSPAAPEVAGARIALHPGEGNTFQTPRSAGELAQLQPTDTRAGAKPVWPLLLFVAAFLFAGERLLSAWRGDAWN